MSKAQRILCLLLCLMLITITASACNKKKEGGTSSGSIVNSGDSGELRYEILEDGTIVVYNADGSIYASTAKGDKITINEDGTISVKFADGTVESGTSGTGSTGSTTSKTQSNPSSSGGNTYNLPALSITNKTVKIYTGPERKLQDYYSTYDHLPGGFEIAQEMYGLKFELVSCGSYNDWYTKLATLIMSGDSPDVAWPASESYPYDILKNNIICLDDQINFNTWLWKDVSGLLDSCSWNDSRYHAVISNGQTMQPVYYNPKLFSQYGVKTPTEYFNSGNWTWDTMRECAVNIYKASGNKINGIGGMLFTAMPESTGKPLVTISGKTVNNNITDPVFASAAQYIYDLGQNGKYKCAVAFSHDNADLFLNGQSAMDVGSTYRVYSTYADLWKQGKIACVPFPEMTKGSGYYTGGVPETMVIFRGSKNINGALGLIYSCRYVNTSEYEVKFASVKKQYGYNDGDWLFEKINGLTKDQKNSIMFIYHNNYKANINTWIGWYDNGWDNGFQYAHEKQWSTILAVYKNQFDQTISKEVATLNALTE